MALPGTAAIPAVDARRARGRRGGRAARGRAGAARAAAVADPDRARRSTTRSRVLHGDRRLDQRRHPPARARRAGRRRADRSSASTSSRDARRVLANVRPSGEYLVEELFHAGGVAAVLTRARAAARPRRADGHRPRRSARTRRRAEVSDRDVIAPLDDAARAGRRASPSLRGLAGPDGRRHQASAPADARSCFAIAARRVVFEGIDDLAARIDDPTLDVDADSVLVLRNAGPVGGPGMPEWGSCRSRRSCSSAGVTRHGADLRRPHERHRVRHRRAARRARGRRRRPARARARRRPDRARRARRARLDLDVADEEIDAPARRPGAAARRTTRAATARSSSSTSCRPTRAATSTSCARSRASRPRASRSASCRAGSAAGEAMNVELVSKRVPRPERGPAWDERRAGAAVGRHYRAQRALSSTRPRRGRGDRFRAARQRGDPGRAAVASCSASRARSRCSTGSGAPRGRRPSSRAAEQPYERREMRPDGSLWVGTMECDIAHTRRAVPMDDGGPP